jgi:hypothetical protein
LIILWVRKGKSEDEKDPSPNDKESCQKHDEIMTKFRTAHPERELKIVAPKDLINTGGNLLVPVDAVKLGRNRQN